jgi:site-specific DNA recombinase
MDGRRGGERGGNPRDPSPEGSVSQETFLSSQAVLYGRVSSKEQEREGYSIPAQRRLLRSYAQRHDCPVVREFVDVETAEQSGRTQLGRMVRLLQEHAQVRILLCEKTDRLYRNFKDYVTIDELDVTLIFVKEGSVLNRQSLPTRSSSTASRC